MSALIPIPQDIPVLEVDVLPARSMPWKCCDCKLKWEGPADRPPRLGCPQCGSRNVLDCNIDLRDAVRLWMHVGHLESGFLTRSFSLEKL